MQLIVCLCYFFLVESTHSQAEEYPVEAIHITNSAKYITETANKLETQLTEDTLHQTQGFFEAFSLGRTKINLSALWRLVAALKATGQKQAQQLAQKIINAESPLANDQQESTLLKKLITSSPSANNEQNQEEAYIANLVPDLHQHWWGCPRTERDDLRTRRLPFILWPQALAKKDIEFYVSRTRLLLMYPEHKIRNIAETLTQQHFGNWQNQARTHEQFFWNITKGEADIEWWIKLCHTKGRLTHWQEFKKWATPIAQQSNIWDRARSFAALAYVWKVLDSNMPDGFMAWVDPITQAIQQPNSKIIALQPMADVWKVMNGIDLDIFLELAKCCMQGYADPFIKIGHIQKWANVWKTLGPKTNKLIPLTRQTEAQYVFNWDEMPMFMSMAQIYKTLDGQTNEFMAWTKPMLAQTPNNTNKADMTESLLHTWHILKEQDVGAFMTWVSPLLLNQDAWTQRQMLSHLALVWTTLNGKRLNEFMKWSEPIVQSDYRQWSQNQALPFLAEVWKTFEGHIPSQFTQQTRSIIQDTCILSRAQTLRATSHMWKTLPNQHFNELMERIAHITREMHSTNKVPAIQAIFEVWNTQNNNNANEFMLWAELMTRGSNAGRSQPIQILSDVWKKLGGKKASEFMSWAELITRGEYDINKMKTIHDLETSWQNLSSKNSHDLVSWKSRIAQRLSVEGKMDELLFLASIWVHGFLRDFNSFLHTATLWQTYPHEFIQAYCSFDHLPLIRSQAAWEAEGSRMERRQLFVEEARHAKPLPTVDAEDIHMREAHTTGSTNAHSLDRIYPYEYSLLVSATQKFALSAASTITTYDKQTPQSHTTNVEVKDFLDYLDRTFTTKTDTHKASVIFQILGLVPSHNTFGSYLGHCMYYGRSDGPTADEFLGRSWAFMKKVAETKGTEKYRQTMNEESLHQKGRGQTMKEAAEAQANEINAILRSVALAIYDAAEIIQTRTEMHCQTRTTGELMKCICWHLEGSKLHPLIAALDKPHPTTSVDAETIQAQITEADNIAVRLLTGIEQEGKNLKALLKSDQSPEPWRIYKALQNDFYGRSYSSWILRDKQTGRILAETNEMDYPSILEQLDADATPTLELANILPTEHLLERNYQTGSLVRRYNAEGGLLPAPLIQWAQASYTAIEHALFLRTHIKYEEQRGL